MTSWKFWVPLTFASASVAIYLVWLDSSFRGDLFVIVLPSILGRTAGLVVIPAVVVGVLVLVVKLFKRAVPNAMVFFLSGVLWLLLVISSINVALFERSWQ